MTLLNLLAGLMRRSAKRRPGSGRRPDRSFRPRVLAIEVLEGRLCPSLYLLVSSFGGSDVQRYDGTTGAFIDEFVAPGSGGLNHAHAIGLGQDGNLLVSSTDGHAVLSYDSATGDPLGEFVTAGSGGIQRPHTWTFGPDGNFYVSDNVGGGGVYRYDGTTGAFIDVFVPGGSGGLGAAAGIVFGPDGNLYVNDWDGTSVMRYDGATGDPLPAPGQTEAFFVAPGSLQNPNLGITFGPDGNLYVGNFSGNSVNRYDGATGEPLPAPGQTGAFFVPAGSGGLRQTHGIAFGPDGNLYVSSEGTNQVLRYDGTTGGFVDAFVNRIGNGGTTGLFFWDTGGDRPEPGPSRSHVGPPGLAHRAGQSDSLVVVAAMLRAPQAGSFFASPAAPDGQAVFQVTPNQQVPGESPSRLVPAAVVVPGVVWHGSSLERQAGDIVFARQAKASSPAWLSTPAIDVLAWTLVQDLA